MVIEKAIKSIQETIQEFIKLETASGIVLFIMALLALLIDNSPWSLYYSQLQEMPITVQIGQLVIAKPLLMWVNDGLMAIFFFLVGLEIKREIIEGELNSLRKLSLPGFAAIGGMVLPAIIYLYFNSHDPMMLRGWAIPAATDIAFALGVLSLLGKRVPVALKVFLTALAILDDIGAMIIIAIFYTDSLSLLSFILAGLAIIVLITLNFYGVRNIGAYGLVGVILWVCVLKSGMHATLSGVIVAMAIPIRNRRDPTSSPLRIIEHSLHPWVAFAVLPVFAFLNAGVSFHGMGLDNFVHPITLGIALGLFIGKQVGVFGFSWIAVKTRLSTLPQKVNWIWIYGVSLLCGIGFTMSLFIGALAFSQTEFLGAAVRLGVILGSFASGIAGYFLLLIASHWHNKKV